MTTTEPAPQAEIVDAPRGSAHNQVVPASGPTGLPQLQSMHDWEPILREVGQVLHGVAMAVRSLAAAEVPVTPDCQDKLEYVAATAAGLPDQLVEVDRITRTAQKELWRLVEEPGEHDGMWAGKDRGTSAVLVPATAGYAEHARDAWLWKADRWPEDADRFRANAEREHAVYSDPERHSQPGQWRDSRPVGWVRRDKLEPYLEHRGDQHGASREVIDALADDFRHGRGWTDPIHLDYDQARHRATMSEGNHRWHAATEAGQEYVPVVVHPARATTGFRERAKPAIFPQAIMPEDQDSVHPSEVLPLHWMMPERKEAAAHEPVSWDQITERHPDTYGVEHDEEEGDTGPGEEIARAAGELAFDRPDEPSEDAWHHASDLDWHLEHVDPRHIDHDRVPPDDSRVRRAIEGYQKDPESVPPLVLVRRHGVYQVADGHHRASAAEYWGMPVRAYVAHSPHEDEPFSAHDGEPPARGPFHGAEPIPVDHEAALVVEQPPPKTEWLYLPEHAGALRAIVPDADLTMRQSPAGHGLTHRLSVSAPDPESGRDQQVAHLTWDADTGRVAEIKTEPGWVRQGVATEVWRVAVVVAQERGLVAPVHSEDQVGHGPAWVRSLGESTAAESDLAALPEDAAPGDVDTTREGAAEAAARMTAEIDAAVARAARETEEAMRELAASLRDAGALDAEHAPGELLHRGVMVEVDPDELAAKHAEGGMEAVHRHIADAALRHPEGLGTHWTSDPAVARRFSHGAISTEEEGPRTTLPYSNTMRVPVVLHAHVPAEAHETDPEKLRDAMVIGHGWSYGEGSKLNHEAEVLLRPRAPVHVTHVEAALPAAQDWVGKVEDHRWGDEEGQTPWRDQRHSWQPLPGAGQHTAAIRPHDAEAAEQESTAAQSPGRDAGRTTIYRGIVARGRPSDHPIFDTDWDPDSIGRVRSGLATAHDILKHINTGSVGEFWHHPDFGDLEDAKDYASTSTTEHPGHDYSLERHHELGEPLHGEMGVVLEGHAPAGWHPDDNLPGGKSYDEENYHQHGGMWMGHSALPAGTDVPLVRVHYHDHEGVWHHADARGHQVHVASSGAPASVISADWDRFRGHPLGKDDDGVTYHYYPAEGGRWPVVKARVGDHPDAEELHGVGDLTWFEEDGPGAVKNAVQMVEVHPDYRRHGIASRLWAHARAINPDLIHSPTDQLPEGTKWAAAVDARERDAVDEEYPDAQRDEHGRVLLWRGVAELAHDVEVKGGRVRPRPWKDADELISSSHDEYGGLGSWWGSEANARHYGDGGSGGAVVSAWFHPHHLRARPDSSGVIAAPGTEAEVHRVEVRHDGGEWRHLEHSPGLVLRTSTPDIDDPHPTHDQSRRQAVISSAGGDDAKLQAYQPPELPDEQRAALDHPDFHTHRRMIDEVAASPPPGTKVWRGENRDVDEHGAPDHGDVGLHWSANPEGTIRHAYAPPGQRQVVWQATVEHPGQTIPRDHPSWGDKDYARESEAEVRLRPGTQVKVDGAWVFHAKPWDENPKYMETPGSFVPMHPERMHPSWRWHPVGERSLVTNEHGRIDYGDRLPQAPKTAAVEPTHWYHGSTRKIEVGAELVPGLDSNKPDGDHEHVWVTDDPHQAAKYGDVYEVEPGSTPVPQGAAGEYRVPAARVRRLIGDPRLAPVDPRRPGELETRLERSPYGSSHRVVVTHHGREVGHLGFDEDGVQGEFVHPDYPGLHDQMVEYARSAGHEHSEQESRVRGAGDEPDRGYEVQAAKPAAPQSSTELAEEDRRQYGRYCAGERDAEAKAGKAAYMRHRRREAAAVAQPGVRVEWGGPHGLASVHDEQGCRCEECVHAKLADRDRYRGPEWEQQRTAAVPSFTWRHQAQTPTGYEDREQVVEGPFYHGSRSKRLREGDTVRPGFKTNPWGDEGGRSSHVHFTTDLDAAGQYAEQAGGHVYEVEPTGEARGGYQSGEYKSQHPLRVIRRVSTEELSAGPREAAVVESVVAAESPARRVLNQNIDWPRELGKMKRGVHRGMRVVLPPEVHDFVHDRMQTPSRQAQAIVEHLRASGVGLHWSPDAKIATDFAIGGKQAGDWNGPKRGETSVVLHAATPSPEHIATPEEIDEARAAGHSFEPHDGWIGGGLKEIPLSPKAPVKVTGVTWYQGSRRRKVTGDVWSAEDPLAGQPRRSRYDAASDQGEAALDEERQSRGKGVPRQGREAAANELTGVEYRYSPTHTGRPGVTAHLPTGERIGELGWNPDTHTIGWVAVYDEVHRRRGVASGMFAKAREIDPEIRHNTDPDGLTEDGAAWATHTGGGHLGSTVEASEPECESCGGAHATDDHDFENEFEDNTQTDWDEVWPEVGPHLHRGVGVELPDHVHRVVHDEARPVHERAQALLDHLASQPQGMHWSEHPDVAEAYATSPNHGYGPGRVVTPVRLTVRKPDLSAVETDADRLRAAKVYGNGGHDEAEVPIREGAPLEAHAISWGDHGATELAHHHAVGGPAQVHAAEDDYDDDLDFPDDEEDEETSAARRTDWDSAYAGLPEHLHRGINVHLPDAVHQVVHDPQRPHHERAAALLEHLRRGLEREDGEEGGLGMHWTGNGQMARRYATDLAATRGGTPVHVTVRRPERSWIEEDPEELARGDVIGHGQVAKSEYYGDTEVPISHGAPLDVHSVSWGDHGGWDLAHHHTLSTPIRAHAVATQTYYHGTTHQMRPGDLVLPAAQHGGHVTFNHDTDPNHAYATGEDSAWDYAEKAHAWTVNRMDRGPFPLPRVYQVEPVHPESVEEDPQGRGNNEDDVRSPHGFRVVKEMPMPDHMGEPDDWRH